MDCRLYAKYTTQVEVPKGDTSGRIKLFNQLSADEATAECEENENPDMA
jgi:hypothetical protein